MKPKLAFSYSALNKFEQCALQYQHMYVLKDIKDVKGEAVLWGQRVHKDFELRVREGKPLPPELQKFEAMMNKFLGFEFRCEWRVCLNPELKPVDFFAHDAYLRGVLDLYVRVSPTVAAVVDYKTGKRKDEFDQLEMFALFVFAHEPEVDEVRSAFVWTQDGKIDQETYRREQAPKLWEKVLAKIRRVYQAQDADVWPARPSGLCNYCGHRPNCAYAR